MLATGFLPRTGFDPELISDHACASGWGLELWKERAPEKGRLSKAPKGWGREAPPGETSRAFVWPISSVLEPATQRG